MIYLDNNKINKTNYNKIYLGDVNIHQNLIDNAIPSGNNILAFEFSGDTPMKYTINGTEYTATTSPVNVKVDNPTDLHNMLYQGDGNVPNNITKVNSIPSSNENTTYTNAFGNCNKLTELDLSNAITTNVSSISYMFAFCSNLSTLDLSNWNLGKVLIENASAYEHMFSDCPNLKTITMKNCNQHTIDVIKAALTQSGIPDSQVTIITE